MSRDSSSKSSKHRAAQEARALRVNIHRSLTLNREPCNYKPK